MWYNNEWGVILYNSLGTGFEIKILDDKKKYAFDFDNNQTCIIIIYIDHSLLIMK